MAARLLELLIADLDTTYLLAFNFANVLVFLSFTHEINVPSNHVKLVERIRIGRSITFIIVERGFASASIFLQFSL